mmetsp:Transcript_5839/g.18413  ORF Transcript_5839/g.18413 Transcript_5839/m.18413 type:complete len:312 (+) Transcript_5839:74-1009(+)
MSPSSSGAQSRFSLSAPAMRSRVAGSFSRGRRCAGSASSPGAPWSCSWSNRSLLPGALVAARRARRRARASARAPAPPPASIPSGNPRAPGAPEGWHCPPQRPPRPPAAAARCRRPRRCRRGASEAQQPPLPVLSRTPPARGSCGAPRSPCGWPAAAGGPCPGAPGGPPASRRPRRHRSLPRPGLATGSPAQLQRRHSPRAVQLELAWHRYGMMASAEEAEASWAVGWERPSLTWMPAGQGWPAGMPPPCRQRRRRGPRPSSEHVASMAARAAAAAACETRRAPAAAPGLPLPRAPPPAPCRGAGTAARPP